MREITKHTLAALPLGESSALSALAIWKVIDCWSDHSIRNELRKLVRSGVAKRKQQQTASGFEWLYWRGTANIGEGR